MEKLYIVLKIATNLRQSMTFTKTISKNFHIFVTPHCQYRSPSFSGTASRQKPLYPQTGLRISLWKFQKTLPIHKPVKIGLKEAVLDDAIFLEF